MASGGKTTLPARYYTDPELYHKEMERFYFRRWIHAGRSERLAKPGDYLLFELNDESVIVARGAARTLQAFYNVCRHRGTRMCAEAQGSFPGGRIRCPYHGWSYGLDGKLLGAPHMSADFQTADYPLRSVQVAEWAGNVFLNFNDACGPLASQLGPLPEVFAAWEMASEHGHWTGSWTDVDGRVSLGGSYFAKWRIVNGAWLVESETYVPERCTGGKYCTTKP